VSVQSTIELFKSTKGLPDDCIKDRVSRAVYNASYWIVFSTVLLFVFAFLRLSDDAKLGLLGIALLGRRYARDLDEFHEYLLRMSEGKQELLLGQAVLLKPQQFPSWMRYFFPAALILFLFMQA